MDLTIRMNDDDQQYTNLKITCLLPFWSLGTAEKRFTRYSLRYTGCVMGKRSRVCTYCRSVCPLDRCGMKR